MMIKNSLAEKAKKKEALSVKYPPLPRPPKMPFD